MIVHGVSFGGGWKGARIYIASGLMSGRELTISDVQHREHWMDLANSIIGSRGLWAFDFPFALPRDVYSAFALRDWEALLGFVEIYEMAQIQDFVNLAGLYAPEDGCQQPGPGCRLTDALSGALSPLKQYWPNVLEMTCEGLKLLGYLRRHDVSVYPFDRPDPDHVRIYEVSPSNTWARVGLGKRAITRHFVQAFNRLEGRAVDLSLLEDTLPLEYDIYAVLSCATLANAIRAFGLDEQWDEMPAFATDPEWAIRLQEGLIVRLQS
jgi:hypothetical protein